MIHLSVAIARFIETLLWALLRAGLSLAGVAVLAVALAVIGTLLIRRAMRRKRKP